MEILNIPTPSRTRLQAKLRLYKSEAEKLKRDLVKKNCQKKRYETKKETYIEIYREEIQPLYLKTLSVMNCLADLEEVMKTDNLTLMLLPWTNVNVY